MRYIKNKEFCQAVKMLSFLHYYWLIYDSEDEGITRRESKRVKFFLKKELYDDYHALVSTGRFGYVKLSSRRYHLMKQLVRTTQRLEKYTANQFVEIKQIP